MQKYVNGALVDLTPAEIAERLAEENAPPPPPYIPRAVSMFQARAVLIQAGLFDTVDATLQATGGVHLQAWEYAQEVQRDSALVQAVAAQLQLSEEQIDALFVAAAQITA